MTREEAQHLLEETVFKFDMDDEDRDILYGAIRDLADPDND